VDAWRNNRKLFGNFVEARVYSQSDGGLIDGRRSRWSDDVMYPESPKMVLIDDQGNELWLSGTPCGYVGQGSSGAEKILREEQFGDAAEAVFDERFVKIVLRKSEDGTVVAELTEQGQTLWDGESRIQRWLWRQEKLPVDANREAEIDRLKREDPLRG
jgi:hypothetical protein